MTRDPTMSANQNTTDLRQTLRIQLMAFGVGFAAAGALLVLLTA